MKREFNKQLHYQLIRQNLSLMDEFYFFAERMACCCHLQAHLSAHLQAHFVYATLI